MTYTGIIWWFHGWDYMETILKNILIKNGLARFYLLKTPLVLLLALLFLASCSRGENGAGPSLNADDLWDQMAAERARPLPIVARLNATSDASANDASANDASEGDSEAFLKPPPPETGSFSPEELDAQRELLRNALKKYQNISQNISEIYSVGTPLNAEERQARMQTVQLYLSRLINLEKSMVRAMNLLEKTGEDQSLLDQSRDLRGIISGRIMATQKRLAEAME